MKKILITSIFFAMGLSFSAQNLYVQPMTGNQVEFELANKPKITFADRIMTITMPPATTQPFSLGEVRNFSFVKTPSETGIAMTMDGHGIRLYPNPVETELTLEIENPTPRTTYRIFNMTGKLVEMGQASSQQTKINMQNFPRGTYVLYVVQNDRQVQSFKIVKQ